MDRVVEVSADPVHFVDEANAGNVVLVGLAPNRFRLRLNACHTVEERYRSVEDPQAALDFGREIDVPGSVNDVDLVLAPKASRGGGRNGDAALLLLLHVVHGGGAVVYLAHAMQPPGVVEDAFGRGGLAGIDMRGNTDVAEPFKWHVDRHNFASLAKT